MFKNAHQTLSNLLYTAAGCVFLMVVVGGLTRLTGSGLSMVDWQPVSGTFPPLTQEKWQALFDLYKTSPQYLKVNVGFSLEEFKGIFWLEYIHRVIGRAIGIFFLLPLFYSLVSRRLRPWAKSIFAIWVLGGLQGLMGWYMVKSGLVNDPWVSPYRLCAHLLIAFVIYGLLLITAYRVRIYPKTFRLQDSLSPSLTAVFILFFITTSFGAFVAGMKAGLLYNTFPLMGDQFVPHEIFTQGSWYQDLLTNPVTVQFTHRLLAISTLFATILYGTNRLQGSLRAKERRWTIALLMVSVGQVMLGITTLLLHVPIDLATLHQAGALVFLSCLVGITVTSRPYKVHQSRLVESNA